MLKRPGAAGPVRGLRRRRPDVRPVLLARTQAGASKARRWRATCAS
ncbi:MAG: hypothetical protein MZW92_13435 [Comamonadaceae bacterium]|nr:hypothetical protein [Comamonadaceae bacterium]